MPPSAVIYYMPDGYNMSGRRLMGRQSAGASFLAGYARHATTRDLVCMAPDRQAAETFSETVRSADRRAAPEQRELDCTGFARTYRAHRLPLLPKPDDQ